MSPRGVPSQHLKTTGLLQSLFGAVSVPVCVVGSDSCMTEPPVITSILNPIPPFSFHPLTPLVPSVPGPGHVFQPGQPLGGHQHPPWHHPCLSHQPVRRRPLRPNAHVPAGRQPDVPLPKERRPGGDRTGAQQGRRLRRGSRRGRHRRRRLHPRGRRRHRRSL